MNKSKILEFIKLEDRVLFEAAAVAEIVEAQANDPNANMNHSDQQAQDEKNAIKNAPVENQADAEASTGAPAALTQPGDVANIDAQIQALIEGEISAPVAGTEAADALINEIFNDYGANAVSDAIHDIFAEAQHDDLKMTGIHADTTISTGTEHELVVINSSVQDMDQIIDSLGTNQEVLVLENGKDAMQQINEYLEASGKEYSAIHIVTHGADGQFVLGDTVVQSDLFDHDAWANVGSHISEGGDILLYGCSLAKSEAGQDLIAMISDATGADVAASVDKTGVNGNWDLEYQYGAVETASISVDGYEHNLGSWTVTNTASSGTGSLTWAITQANADHDSATDYIRFHSDLDGATITVTSSVLNISRSADAGQLIIDTEGLDVTISGNGTYRIMNISSTSDVVINGLTFAGGKTSSSSYGGAITNAGTLEINDSEFIGNSAYNSGAIYNTGTLEINNTTFANNSATYYGGAIYNAGAMVINGSTFNGNTAKGISSSNGGAIYNAETGTLEINGSNFSNNSASFQGGAIHTSGDIEITDSSFSKNTSGSGGAMYANLVINVTITNSTFTENASTSASLGGGALALLHGPNTTITNSIFTGNTAVGRGGAIYGNTGSIDGVDYPDGTIEFTDSKFTGNSSDNSGGAIFAQATTLIIHAGTIGTTFTDNVAKASGGAIYAGPEAPLTIYAGDSSSGTKGTTFTNNRATTNGGAIFASRTTMIDKVTFEYTRDDAAATNGGAIYYAQSTTASMPYNITIKNSTFSNFYTTTTGGAIYSVGQLIIEGSEFTNNRTGSYGGSIYHINSSSTYLSTIDGAVFKYTLASNAAGYGGGVFTSGSLLTITNSSFDALRANYGGAIYAGTALTIGSGVSFTGNIAANYGGGIYSAATTLTIGAGTNFTSNRATNGGAIAIYATTAGGITQNIGDNVTFNGNIASGNGGAIWIQATAGPANLIIGENNKFTGNNGNEGGAIYIHATTSSANLEIGDDAEFTSNKATGATGRGGAIFVYANALAITVSIGEDSNFSKNTAGGTGGAVYAYAAASSVSVTIGKDANFEYNESGASGGAIWLGLGSLTLNNANFTGNMASASGGAVYTTGQLILNGGTYDGNKAVDGGAIFNSGTLEVNGSKFYRNQATGASTSKVVSGRGGAIYATGSLTVNGGQFGDKDIDGSGNTATNGYGGAIYAAGTLTIGSDASGNRSGFYRNSTAGFNGGAIYAAAGASITGMNAGGNSAVLGGGIYGLGTLNISNSDISGNKATDGAGIYVSGAQLTLTNSTVNSNIAARNGGGVFATANSTFSMTGGAVSGNMAGSTTVAGLGGGLYFNNTAFSLNGTVVSGNTATSHGGGIYGISNTATALAGTLTNVTLGGDAANAGNKAANGGGAYITGSYAITVSGTSSLIAGNEATAANGLGGGLAIINKATLSITGATISGNKSASRGGGIYMISVADANTALTLTDVNITDNLAVTDGGGIYIRNGVAATLNNVMITDNEAERYGGGIGIDASSMDLSATTISGNYAATYGGGIYTVSALTINAGVKIINNESGEYGGGILASGADAIITLNTVIGGSATEGNTAKNGGGVALINTATLNMNNANSNISYNTATYGGGVFILAEKKGNGGGTLNMTAGTISHNTATKSGGAIYGDTGTIANISGVSIDANTAGVNGGAIYSKGNLNLNSVSFSGNKADNQGGALYLVDGSTFSGAGTLNFTNNEAKADGGAIYSQIDLNISAAFNSNSAKASGGAIYGEKSLSISDSKFDGNSATVNGGAVYAAGDLMVTHSEFRRNTAAVNGGAVYAAGDNVTMDNTLIADGSAVGKGGGIYLADTVKEAELINLTIASNKAGGGIYTDSANVWVLNSILWGNTGNQYVGLDNLKVFNSGIQGWTFADYVTQGNVNLHKDNSADNIGLNNLNSLGNYYVCFVNVAAGNYQLNEGSYAINRGSNSYVAVSKDLAGNARIDKSLVDMGAYESSYKGNVVLNASGTDIIYGNTKTLSAGQDGYGSNGFSYESGNSNYLAVNGDQATAMKAKEHVNVTVKYLGDANWNTRSTTVVVNTLVRDITLTAQGGNYTYDGTTHAFTWDGKAGGLGFAFNDTLTSYDANSYRNAGTYDHDEVLSNVKIGTMTDNYYIIYGEGTMTIGKATLVVTRDGSDKVYNGNSDAEYTWSFDGLVKGDKVNYTKGTASFADKNVGEDKTVTFSGDSLTGADLGNYSVSYNDLGADITKATLTITAESDHFTYDSQTYSYSWANQNGLAGSDRIANATSNNFRNAGTYTNALTDATVLDADGINMNGNYTIVFVDGTVVIDKAVLVITRDGSNKVYNGSTDAEYTWSYSPLGNDEVIYHEGTAAFLDKNVGENKTVTFSGDSVTGADAGNYEVVYNDLGADITKATLTITAESDHFTYDSQTYSFSWANQDGLANGDTLNDVTVNSFRNAGTYTNALTDATVRDADGNSMNGNYNIVFVNGTVVIDKALLVVTRDGSDKVYNGSTDAEYTWSLDGKVNANDEVTYNEGTAAFLDKNVGENKTVTFSGDSVTGADAGNYEVVYNDLGADITKATLTITAESDHFTYDGQTYSYSWAGQNGLAGSDTFNDVTVNSFRNAGTYTNVLTNVTVRDADGINMNGNYNIVFEDGTVVIDKAVLVVTRDGSDKVYDGNTNANYTWSLDGKVNGDDVTYNKGTAAFLDKNAGSGKEVVFSGDNLDGTDLGNYDVVYNDNGADISKATLTIVINDQSKNFGTVDPAFTGTATGLVGGDTVDSYNRTDKGEAAGKYAIDQYQLHDDNGGQNYNVTVINGTLTIGVPANTNIYMDAASKNYVINGMDHASLVQSVSVMSANREADTVLDTETSGNANSVSHQTSTRAGEKAKSNLREESQKKLFEETDKQVVQQRTNLTVKGDLFSDKGEKSGIVESHAKKAAGSKFGGVKIVVPAESNASTSPDIVSEHPMNHMPSQINLEGVSDVIHFSSVDLASVNWTEKADNLKDKLDIVLEEMMVV